MSTASIIVVGDMFWMDGAHLPHQIPSKLVNKSFSPYKVLSVHGITEHLNLTESLNKIYNLMYMYRSMFFESRVHRDSAFGASRRRRLLPSVVHSLSFSPAPLAK